MTHELPAHWLEIKNAYKSNGVWANHFRTIIVVVVVRSRINNTIVYSQQ